MAWRRFRRLTQAQLAERVETTAAVISLLESGHRPLSDKWLRSLAKALDTQPGHLLDYDPESMEVQILDALEDVPAERYSEVREMVSIFRRKGATNAMAMGQAKNGTAGRSKR